MRAVNLAEDIKTVSEFRANSAGVIAQARETGRPIVLTQNGRSAVVLVDVREFERLLNKAAIIQDVDTAQRQIGRGEGVPHEEVKEMILQGIRS